MIGRQAFCGNRVFYFFKFFFAHTYMMYMCEKGVCMGNVNVCFHICDWLRLIAFPLTFWGKVTHWQQSSPLWLVWLVRICSRNSQSPYFLCTRMMVRLQHPTQDSWVLGMCALVFMPAWQASCWAITMATGFLFIFVDMISYRPH